MAETIGITGGRALKGRICVQGSKNAALPILAASILHRGLTVLYNCPQIADVDNMLYILECLGCRTQRTGHMVCVDASGKVSVKVEEAWAGNMRSLIFFLGSLVGRASEAHLPYPGGCVIGARPIDLHVGGLRALGVSVTEEETQVHAWGRPTGGIVRLPLTSVGTTENLLMAAAGAAGETLLCGCAREPEVTALCKYLVCIGAGISGAGTDRIRIRPIRKKKDIVRFTIPGDRIVAGTYALAAIGCGGSICIRGIAGRDLCGQLAVYRRLGATAAYYPRLQTLHVRAPKKLRAVPQMETAPFPGFPTDLQSQLLVVLTKACGKSSLTERIFEQRFKVVEELKRMGAHICVEENRAVIQGPAELHGAHVEAQELRGGAGLVIAGLMADGESEIGGVAYLKRGYENICRDFQQLGAQIVCRDVLA